MVKIELEDKVEGIETMGKLDDRAKKIFPRELIFSFMKEAAMMHNFYQFTGRCYMDMHERIYVEYIPRNDFESMKRDIKKYER